MIESNLNGKTQDITADNIVALKALFPEVVCENGIDFNKLQALLGNVIVSENERYNFTWNGKGKSLNISQTPSNGTLRPCIKDSKNWDTTQNLYIEGDNLEVLKLLQKGYHSKVDVIYIDPPYNTGSDFVYSDDFRDNTLNYLRITGQIDFDGSKISTNTETNGRYHTDWLNMIYPRLRLARNLLSDDGLIFISIDDNEATNLKKVCDEIFGESNFYCTFVWQRRSGSMDSVDNVSVDHEYILCYGKIKNMLTGIARTFSRYANPDNDPRGEWISDNLSAGKPGGDVYYPIVDPVTKHEFYPPKGRYWPYSRATMTKKIEEGRVLFPANSDGRPMLKRFKNEAKNLSVPVSTVMKNCTEKEIPNNTLVYALNTRGTSELQELFDDKVFSYPKSTVLIKSILSQVVRPNALVLDFFSGSSTTAHAVMQMNSEDGENRKFIMVQLPEPCSKDSEALKANFVNLCEIGKERIRRAGEKIKAELKEKNNSQTSIFDVENYVADPEKLDIGFKVFKLDSSNLKKWSPDNPNIESSLEDMVNNYIPGRSELDVVYEIMLKYGIALTLPISERAIAGSKVYSIGYGALIICLDDHITTDIASGIVKLKSELNPEVMRVVVKDNGFKNDSEKTNIKESLKTAGIDEFVTV